MIWLIKFLIFGKCCGHIYEILAARDVTDGSGRYYVAKRYDCRCTKCGHMKKFEL